MARLGAGPRLAVAVSGGADSTALALLARDWAAENNSDILALIVDHGLRPEAGAEAALTAARLQALGISTRILEVTGLAGAGIQDKARAARYAILGAAAAEAGRLQLLLGHHTADQSETVLMRAARGPRGAEGMAAWTARDDVVLLRPLLRIEPARLRAYLAARGVAWIEDSSNQSQKFERVRMRQSGDVGVAAQAEGRQREEREAAAFLARHACIRPEGFALLDVGAAPMAALGALIRVIGGADYPPRREAVARLAIKIQAATLGGVRILPAGRLGGGWLLVREPAACAPAVVAERDVIWDRRFTLTALPAAGAVFGGLGSDAKKFRHYNNLPAVALRAMPCLRDDQGRVEFPVPAEFSPPAPATSHPFFS